MIEAPNSYTANRLADMDSDKVMHIYPQFGREHITDQKERCWCEPEVMFEPNDGALIIHKAEQ